jgi:hypothetical protein
MDTSRPSEQESVDFFKGVHKRSLASMHGGRVLGGMTISFGIGEISNGNSEGTGLIILGAGALMLSEIMRRQRNLASEMVQDLEGGQQGSDAVE